MAGALFVVLDDNACFSLRERVPHLGPRAASPQECQPQKERSTRPVRTVLSPRPRPRTARRRLLLAERELHDRRGHPDRADDTGVGRPGGEAVIAGLSGAGESHFTEALPHLADRAGHTGGLVYPGVPGRHGHPRQDRWFGLPDDRSDLPQRRHRHRRYWTAADRLLRRRSTGWSMPPMSAGRSR